MLSAALEHQFGSAEALETCERELRKLLSGRGIYFGEGLLPTYAHAFVVAREHVDRWSDAACRFVSAAENAARLLLDEPGFFEAMHLGRDALELVRVDPGYKRICVLCRPDGLPTEHDMKFVELNSDSPAMMRFIDVVAECLLELEAFAWLRAHPRPVSSSDRLLDTLLACYREFGGTRQPNIAITDWEGQKTRFEHKGLADHFEARGYATVVCDPRAFRLIGGELHAGDKRIDIVYRRALASEVIARQSELPALLAAYRDGTICMVNPLRSYIAGAKSVLSYLTTHEASDLVPHTVLLDTPKARERVARSPSNWVLKKSESHGGQNVILPGPANEAAWRAALESASSDAWIAQEYIEVPRLTVASTDGNPEKYFNWNPFVFGGAYAGGLVRVSETPLINITLGGGLLPTFVS